MDPRLPFHSILFDRAQDEAAERDGEPECFHDLRLDQIVASITASRQDYDLAPFFHMPLRTVESIGYRHAIFRDLEDRPLARRVASFGASMRAVRERLAQSEKAHYPLQRQRWFLDAVSRYVEAVCRLADDLGACRLQSDGLTAFREYLGEHLRSAAFSSMQREARQVEGDLAAIRYDVEIDGGRIEVSRHGGAPDYGAEVARTFAKFERGAAKDYRFRFNDYPEMNHVEAAILERVALLFPQAFTALAAFCERYRDVVDPVIRRFDREVQFYLAYLEGLERLKAAGLGFCYPEVSDRSKTVRAEETFDLALAARLVADGKRVVTNDFALEGPERILVVSGANQGGKTTFARAFGQLHYLAALGCPVPGREARLFLFDRICTHFEREESVATLSGKLEDELLRMHRILDGATPRSILIMNESFGSTTLADALYLGKQVLRQIIERGMLCVCVTFLDELAALGPTTVSMVSQVAPHDPAVRTFRIVRQPANGLAHALAIARKYRLTYQDVLKRVEKANQALQGGRAEHGAGVVQEDAAGRTGARPS